MGDKENRISNDAIDDEDWEDPYDTRIKKSGCWNEHVKLQDCHFNTRDFRQCKLEMDKLKECWKRHNEHQMS